MYNINSITQLQYFLKLSSKYFLVINSTFQATTNRIKLNNILSKISFVNYHSHLEIDKLRHISVNPKDKCLK